MLRCAARCRTAKCESYDVASTACGVATHRHELGPAQALGEPSIAGEHDTQGLARIEIFRRQDAQLDQDLRQRLLRLVDDQHPTAQRGGKCARTTASCVVLRLVD